VPVPLCKDCRFMLAPIGANWICTHPSSWKEPETNFLTGAAIEGTQVFCVTARKGILKQRCGPEGRFWEPREKGII
jgi:hypothetical protein